MNVHDPTWLGYDEAVCQTIQRVIVSAESFQHIRSAPLLRSGKGNRLVADFHNHMIDGVHAIQEALVEADLCRGEGFFRSERAGSRDDPRVRVVILDRVHPRRSVLQSKRVIFDGTFHVDDHEVFEYSCPDYSDQSGLSP